MTKAGLRGKTIKNKVFGIWAPVHPANGHTIVLNDECTFINSVGEMTIIEVLTEDVDTTGSFEGSEFSECTIHLKGRPCSSDDQSPAKVIFKDCVLEKCYVITDGVDVCFCNTRLCTTKIKVNDLEANTIEFI